jgi:hypothetical protein
LVYNGSTAQNPTLRGEKRADIKWLTQIEALLNYQLLGLARPFWDKPGKLLEEMTAILLDKRSSWGQGGNSPSVA